MEYICVDKNGWPVEGIINKPILTFIRRLLFTRGIRKIETVEKEKGVTIKFLK